MTMFFCSIYRAASYNNPHEMFPSASKLFSGMTAAAGNVTKLNMAKSSTSMTVVNEGEEGNINLQTWNSIILFFSQRKSERRMIWQKYYILYHYGNIPFFYMT